VSSSWDGGPKTSPAASDAGVPTAPGPVGAPTGPVHFWTAEVTQSDVLAWDPDREPERFATGRGHALYELFVRLHRRGRPVTLGRDVPRGAHVILTALECIAYHYVGIRPGDAVALNRAALRVPRVIFMRINVPYSIPVPRYASVVVASNIATATGPRDRWLPFLPQRGLVPRDSGRGTRIATVGLKSFPENVPDYVRDGRLEAALRPMGVKVRVDTTAATWPDFASLDAVICDRKSYTEIDGGTLAHKPPTKLINAWCAGAVPIVAPEPAYLDLARDGRDSVLAEGIDATVAAVERLCSEPDCTDALFAGITERSREFAADRVLEQWERLLWSAAVEPHRAEAVVAMAELAASQARARIVRFGRRLRRRTKRNLRRLAGPVLRRSARTGREP
jgi:hypothetical protein